MRHMPRCLGRLPNRPGVRAGGRGGGGTSRRPATPADVTRWSQLDPRPPLAVSSTNLVTYCRIKRGNSAALIPVLTTHPTVQLRQPPIWGHDTSDIAFTAVWLERTRTARPSLCASSSAAPIGPCLAYVQSIRRVNQSDWCWRGGSTCPPVWSWELHRTGSKTTGAGLLFVVWGARGQSKACG